MYTHTQVHAHTPACTQVQPFPRWSGVGLLRMPLSPSWSHTSLTSRSSTRFPTSREPGPWSPSISRCDFHSAGGWAWQPGTGTPMLGGAWQPRGANADGTFLEFTLCFLIAGSRPFWPGPVEGETLPTGRGGPGGQAAGLLTGLPVSLPASSTISITTSTWWPTRCSTSARQWPLSCTMRCPPPSENSSWRPSAPCVESTTPWSHSPRGPRSPARVHTASSSGAPPGPPAWMKLNNEQDNPDCLAL